MKIRKIIIGVSAVTSCGVLASAVIIAVMPAVYDSKGFTMMDGSTGYVVLSDHQAFTVNTHPELTTPRVDLIGDYAVRDNAIKIEAPNSILQCKSIEGQMHWNRIDWTFNELNIMNQPEPITDQRVFLPWSVIAISRQIPK